MDSVKNSVLTRGLAAALVAYGILAHAVQLSAAEQPQPPSATTPAPAANPADTMPGVWMVKETTEFVVGGGVGAKFRRARGQVDTYQWMVNLRDSKLAVDQKTETSFTFDTATADRAGVKLGFRASWGGWVERSVELKWEGEKLVGNALYADKDSACYVRITAIKVM